MNDKRTKLIQEIFDLTTIIQKTCPELYKNLSETPLFISYEEKEIKTEDYRKYLDFLKNQLKEFSKTYRKTKVVNSIKTYKIM